MRLLRPFVWNMLRHDVQEYRKVVELANNILVAASGEQGDVEVFVEWLKVQTMSFHL